MCHQLIAIQKRGEIGNTTLTVADRIDPHGEEAMGGETLEFLPMGFLVAMEAMVEQDRGAWIRVRGEGKQRNTRDFEPALDQRFRRNDRRIALPVSGRCVSRMRCGSAPKTSPYS